MGSRIFWCKVGMLDGLIGLRMTGSIELGESSKIELQL